MRWDIVSGICMLLLVVGMCDAVNRTRPANYTSYEINVSCGNRICEITENVYNCPDDCMSETLSLSRVTYEYDAEPGDIFNYSFVLENLASEALMVNVSLSSVFRGMAPLLHEIVLEPYETRLMSIPMTIDEDQENIMLSGVVLVSADDFYDELPLTIVVRKHVKNLQKYSLAIKVTESQITRDVNNTVEIMLMRLDDTADMLSIPVRVDLYRLGEDRTLGGFEKIINLTESMRRMYTLPTANLSEGEYFVKVVAPNDVADVAVFSVVTPFWTPERVKMFVYILFGLIVAGVMGFMGYKYYIYRKHKRRYIMPNFSLIPKHAEDAFWLGYIAGTKKKAYYDSKDLTTHVLCAGSTGAGKSVAASVFVEEALLKKIPVVIFDPTAQWTGFVKPCTDKNLLKYYNDFGMKEFDAHSFRGVIYNVNSPEIDLDFKEYMNPGEVTIFNLSKLQSGQYDVAVKNIIRTIFRIDWPESKELKLLVVFDEVHRLLEKYGGTGGYVALEQACREFRKWGIGLIMASQVSADFKEAIAGNILTEIQLNTKSMEDIAKVSEKYGEDYSIRITRQGIGVGLIQSPQYNNGKPWFVRFRPTMHLPHKLEDRDLVIYMNYSEQLKLIKKLMGRIKNQDAASDLELTYNLALNKLKEGQFRTVEIYLDSLKSALEKEGLRLP